MKRIISLATIAFVLSGTFLNVPSSSAAGLAKGYVTFTVDDNESSVYSLMYPALKKYNFPATSYVISDWMNTSGHLAWSQLATLQNSGGWEIGNHTSGHKNLTTLKEFDILKQISKCQNDLVSHGIRKPKAFAAPYGEFNSQIIKILKSQGYTSNRWAWPETDKFNEPGSFDAFGINVVSLRSPLTYEDAKKLVDEAIRDKKWLVFVLHGIVSGTAGDYQWSVADLQKLSDYLNSKKKAGSVDVKTISQGLEIMKQGASSSASNDSQQNSGSSTGGNASQSTNNTTNTSTTPNTPTATSTNNTQSSQSTSGTSNSTSTGSQTSNDSQNSNSSQTSGSTQPSSSSQSSTSSQSSGSSQNVSNSTSSMSQSAASSSASSSSFSHFSFRRVFSR